LSIVVCTDEKERRGVNSISTFEVEKAVDTMAVAFRGLIFALKFALAFASAVENSQIVERINKKQSFLIPIKIVYLQLQMFQICKILRLKPYYFFLTRLFKASVLLSEKCNSVAKKAE